MFPTSEDFYIRFICVFHIFIPNTIKFRKPFIMLMRIMIISRCIKKRKKAVLSLEVFVFL